MRADDSREPVLDAAESETPRMRGNSQHGNRESPGASSQDGGEERSGKAAGRTPDMHARGQSDDSIVPKKRANKASGWAGSGYSGTRRRKGEATENTNTGLNQPTQAAEPVEERGSIEGNAEEEATRRTQCRESGSSGLDRIREVAKRDKKVRFTALLHHIDVALLRWSFSKLKREARPGVDGVTWKQYEEGLEDRLVDLHERFHRGAYRAQPSKRAWIPKPDGRQRPIGIAALEDKIVQQAIRTILEQIYEADFLGFSYGFRPGRGSHNALDALYVGIVKRKVNYVLDADIRGFFDQSS